MSFNYFAEVWDFQIIVYYCNIVALTFNMNSYLKLLGIIIFSVTVIALSSCENDDPTPENIPELITKVTLKFTPAGGGAAITVTATDPDGEGVQDISVDGPINLLKGVQYTLSLELINGLYDPGEDGYNITEEVKEEGDEHQFFFRFSEGVFSSPTGTGNIKDNASSVVGAINYMDEDSGGLPIGIETSLTAINATATDKSFRLLLKHQPDVKSSTSDSLDGESDLDITFVVNVN